MLQFKVRLHATAGGTSGFTHLDAVEDPWWIGRISICSVTLLNKCQCWLSLSICCRAWAPGRLSKSLLIANLWDLISCNLPRQTCDYNLIITAQARFWVSGVWACMKKENDKELFAQQRHSVEQITCIHCTAFLHHLTAPSKVFTMSPNLNYIVAVLSAGCAPIFIKDHLILFDAIQWVYTFILASVLYLGL